MNGIRSLILLVLAVFVQFVKVVFRSNFSNNLNGYRIFINFNGTVIN